MEVIKIMAINQILAGSDPQLGEEYDSSSDGDPLGRGTEYEF